MQILLQKSLHDLEEIDWHPVRKELAKGVYGKQLTTKELIDVKIVLTKVKPSGEFPPHEDLYHHIFYFMEGTGEGLLGNDTYLIKSELVVEVPSGVKHGYRNTRKTDLVLLTINIPHP